MLHKKLCCHDYSFRDETTAVTSAMSLIAEIPFMTPLHKQAAVRVCFAPGKGTQSRERYPASAASSKIQEKIWFAVPTVNRYLRLFPLLSAAVCLLKGKRAGKAGGRHHGFTAVVAVRPICAMEGPLCWCSPPMTAWRPRPIILGSFSAESRFILYPSAIRGRGGKKAPVRRSRTFAGRVLCIGLEEGKENLQDRFLRHSS